MPLLRQHIRQHTATGTTDKVEVIWDSPTVVPPTPKTKNVAAKGCLIALLFIVGFFWWINRQMVAFEKKQVLPKYIDTAMATADSIRFKDVKISKAGKKYKVSAIVENYSTKKINSLDLDCKLYDDIGDSTGIDYETVNDLYPQKQSVCNFEVSEWGGGISKSKTFQLKVAYVHWYKEDKKTLHSYTNTKQPAKKKKKQAY